MNRVRWLEAKWPVSMRTLAQRLKERPFSSEHADGFIVHRVRDTLIEGRFFERVAFEETIRDPFGIETTFERLIYREVEFVFSNVYPQIELRNFPRNTQAFVTRTAEVTDFGTTLIPLTIDAFKWVDNVRGMLPSQFRIDVAQLSEVFIEDGVLAKVVLSGVEDIRAALGRFTKGRRHRIDRLQIRLRHTESTISFQLSADGTLRSADVLSADVLDAIRRALPRAIEKS